MAKASVGGHCGTETLDPSDFDFTSSANSSSSSISSTSGLTIANKCFNSAFKACNVATLMAVANFTWGGNKADEETDYAIIGPKGGGCEVKQTYVESTILPPDFVGTYMTCTLDNKLIFTAALSKVTNDGLKGCTGSFIEKSGISNSN